VQFKNALSFLICFLFGLFALCSDVSLCQKNRLKLNFKRQNVPFLSLFCDISKIIQKSQKNQVNLTRNNITTNTQRATNFLQQKLIIAKTKTYF
jgi:hypothetical protein